jgi:hypothetical protein
MTDSPESRFPSERYLQGAGRNGKAVCFAREDRFDPRTAMFYAPVVYQLGKLDLELPKRASDTVALKDFVRDEFPISPPSGSWQTPEGDQLEIDFLATAVELTKNAESAFVFNNPRLAALVADVKFAATATRLHRLFSSDDFGQGANARFVSADQLGQALDMRSDPRSGIHVVLPCLPFRDQNPFRTADEPSSVTLAEVLFFARLHAWKLATYRLLPGGGHVVCLCDGTLYADALGVPVRDAVRYLDALRRVRDSLDLARSVSLVDLRQVAENVAEAVGLRFWDEVEATAERLRALVADRRCRELFESLIVGMRWNVSPTAIECSDRRELSEVLEAAPARLLRVGAAEPTSASGRLLHASLRYAAINLVLRWLDPIRRAFPEFVRFTMHPKPGQLALPRLGRVHPWNGVAFSAASADDSYRMRIEPLWRLAEQQVTELVDPRWQSSPVGYIAT